MAIDMTTVKQIMHNNKEVVKIEDGLGKVLWQKPEEHTWHTVYDNSSGYDLRLWANKGWATTRVPCNISTKATKLRIKYKHEYDYNGKPSGKYVKLIWGNGGSNPVTVTPDNYTTNTVTFDYTQGKDIVFGTYSTSNNWFNTAYQTAQWSWYQNATWGGSTGSDWTSNGNRYSVLVIYKVEEYY